MEKAVRQKQEQIPLAPPFFKGGGKSGASLGISLLRARRPLPR